jgi:hypothetical protein
MNKLTLLFLFFISFLGFSQVSPSNEPGEIDPPPAPIDSFLFILFIAGLLCAGYFIYKNNLKIEKND